MNIARAILPPLALYIHVPWCARKCPYCDFNSHEASGALPERDYIAALLADLQQDHEHVQSRRIESIFIGGGTPSLFSPAAYAQLFRGLQQHLTFSDDIEITLEANPGSVEQQKFREYRHLGINRLSIGVQSFNAAHLQALGRIHGRAEALQAADAARRAGFDNFNLDLMHGLPQQSAEDALADLAQAIALEPAHLSWYQLTIEPNTVFHSRPPTLPADDLLADIEEAGFACLETAGYRRYEISAFARSGVTGEKNTCRHNLNYWQFGDYLALGAGAHGKITRADGSILRYRKTRLPRDYLLAAQRIPDGRSNPFNSDMQPVPRDEQAVEFMLNALRLVDGVDAHLFAERTVLTLPEIAGPLRDLRARELLLPDENRIACTPTGLRFLNDVVNAFVAI